MEHTISVRRLVVFLALVVGVNHAMYVVAALNFLWFLYTNYSLVLPSMFNWPGEPIGYGHGWSGAILQAAIEPAQILRGMPSVGWAEFLPAKPALWASVLTVASLAMFRPTLKHFRIRHVHLLRVVSYAITMNIAIVHLPMLFDMIATRLRWGSPFHWINESISSRLSARGVMSQGSPFLVAAFLMTNLIIQWAWWWLCCKHYLRIRHAAAVAAAIVSIAWLIVCLFAVLTGSKLVYELSFVKTG